MVKGQRTGRALAAVTALVLAAGVRATPGNGIRMGGSSARLRPFVELEGRYDSNVAYSADAGARPGYVLHLRPGLTLDSQSDRTSVSFAGSADWAQYSGENEDLSRLYGEATLGVGVNRRGQLGLELTDAFRRTQRTEVLVLGGAVISNVNALDVSIPWRPGGGALTTTVGGGWTLESFEPFSDMPLCPGGGAACDPSQVSKLNYSDVSGRLELRWRFLPRTAVVVQGEYWKRLPSDPEVGGDASGWRANGGLAGLFGAHLAGTIKAGYASTTTEPDTGGTWYANVEGEWIPIETASVKLGYLHDSGADPGVGGGYSGHRLYLDGRVLLAGRYSAQLTTQYERRDYDDSPTLRSGDIVSVSPVLEAEVARWLRAGLGAAYTRRTSRLVPGTAQLPGYAFDKVEAFLRVRGTY